jgi:hypothetical protein
LYTRVSFKEWIILIGVQDTRSVGQDWIDCLFEFSAQRPERKFARFIQVPWVVDNPCNLLIDRLN